MQINSIDWWNDEFTYRWNIVNIGDKQTTYFANLFVDNLNTELSNELNKNYTAIDVGCALGGLVYLFKNKFPKLDIVGMDFSKIAIENAKIIYPKNKFICGTIEDSPEKFDIVITSNTLEHYHSPLIEIEKQMSKCNYLYFALVPYNQKNIEGTSHFYSFKKEDFPMDLFGFKKIYQKIIISHDKYFWNGYQILNVYRRSGMCIEVIL